MTTEKKRRAVPLNHLSIEETAKIIGMSWRTLQKNLMPYWKKQNESKLAIPAKKHNGKWVFKKDDVKAYMEAEFGETVDI